MKKSLFLHLFEFRLIDDALDNSQWLPAHIFGATFAVIANIKCRNSINCDLKYQNNISHNNINGDLKSHDNISHCSGNDAEILQTKKSP